MPDFYFEWKSDTDGDGLISDESARYSSVYWLPNLPDGADGGAQARVSSYPTLDGNTMVLAQGRAGYLDGRAPGVFTLNWEVADPDFVRLAEIDYARGRLVQVRLDHRWALDISASGLNITVAAGLLYTGGDTYELASDSTVEAGGSDVHLYATPNSTTGAFTVDTGTSVPAGSVELCPITVAGGAVTLGALTGAANPRQGYITGWNVTQGPGMNDGLEITMQEVR